MRFIKIYFGFTVSTPITKAIDYTLYFTSKYACQDKFF